MKLRFWKKRELGTGSVPRTQPVQSKAKPGPFTCRHCGGDTRREAFLMVRRVSTFYALYPGPDGSPLTTTLDDPAADLWIEGENFCAFCALTKPVPGLDREALRKLIIERAAAVNKTPADSNKNQEHANNAVN